MTALRATASIGVTALRSDDTTDSFVKRADEAMYQAKHAGRNQVVTAV
jgi:diguanylate cyclase (GGDEF)-like protein